MLRPDSTITIPGIQQEIPVRFTRMEILAKRVRIIALVLTILGGLFTFIALVNAEGSVGMATFLSWLFASLADNAFWWLLYGFLWALSDLHVTIRSR